MDYTQVLNDINSKLATIISLLQNFDSGTLMNYMIMLFTVFLLLYVLRGE